MCAAAGEAIILHYMDDVLVCAPNDDLLSHALDLTVDSLVAAGFELQEEKIQRLPPWKFLGLEIHKRTIVPQKLAVKNNIKTLADVPAVVWVFELGEKSSDAMKHLIQAFSFLGIPKSIKTDNGPTYTSKEFRSFLQQWGVEHKAGIPYSLTEERIEYTLSKLVDDTKLSDTAETPEGRNVIQRNLDKTEFPLPMGIS
ncbi:hypothetical protein DUI87_00603 [Hirundo rustica rustica]|uniref:ribonuclease H n=1 Tax=Hirundo rustica rustica TaxID=333673 RepID=A0A3M0LAZ5_HIRRU|nr:hypothetical protein DUI87_00603 [Hirundo rustica rustica]